MAPSHQAEVIRDLFAAYIANDKKSVADKLTDDFRFTSPYDDNIDKQAYFERCWKDTGWIAQHELEHICVAGDAAFVTYRRLDKDGKSFRNTEFLVFLGDKIRRIDVYFGAAYQDGVFVPQQGAP